RAPDGASPLHLAARRGQHAAVTLLETTMRASDVDATAGPRRRTALHDAVLSGSADTVSALLRAGADANKADAFGQTPLHLLATKDPLSTAALASVLLWSGADPSRADARGFTALHAAAATDDLPLVRALVLRAPLVEAKTPGGETALDVALRYARDRAAEALLKVGATPTREGAWPPLHEAARTDALERAASLLASGVDAHRRANGKTALEIAQEHGCARVEALLRERAR
ncbi:MAG: ankyrin repeat domain-containing protein, partial [Labilithrix sp.]|nr:ankyrin repeat domain-containing protein [Labilithrix sp.]